MADAKSLLALIAASLVGPDGRIAQRPGRPLPTTTGGDLSWLREDGTKKGQGFLGPLLLPNGTVVTEYSIADSERLKDASGNYRDYPSIVPTLSPGELAAVLRAAAQHVALPDSVYDKAESFALERQRRGLPLFAQGGEQMPYMPAVPSHKTLRDLTKLR